MYLPTTVLCSEQRKAKVIKCHASRIYYYIIVVFSGPMSLDRDVLVTAITEAFLVHHRTIGPSKRGAETNQGLMSVKALDIFLFQVVKIGVVEGILGSDTVLGVISQEHFEQFHARCVQVVRNTGRVLRLEPNRERRVPVL
jgi:hypothetical protein